MHDLLKNKVLMILILSDIIQQTAIWIRNIALLFFIMEKTNDSPIYVSLLTVIEYTPIFLFSFIGGTLADRWNPKKAMIYGDLASAISLLVIIFFVTGGNWQAIFFATLVSSVVSQISQPSTSIMIKKHIPEKLIAPAIGITQSLVALFLIIGPVIGTLIYSWLGIQASLISIMIAFLISAFSLLFLPNFKKDAAHKQHSNLINEMQDGFHYVIHSKNLVIIAITFGIIGLSAGIVHPLDVFIIIERLGLEKENLQWFYILAGIGMLLGSISASILANKMNIKMVIVGALCFLSVTLIIEVLSVWIALTSTMRFLTGFLLALWQTTLGMLVIKMVDEKFIGRANGILTPLFIGGMLIGSALAGPLMVATSLINAFLIAGSITLISALISTKLTFKSSEKLTKTKKNHMHFH
ncbi:MFS transporter [Chengkuizengella axinellae]|uniref:MFS transporter n=1 Tax=Chengkuizengella axinellae TaxID=3064388 RepID=A0ABT9IXL0_9BACL|nr:MFS transporter [Chengkuizengella sp. 2205SS18-9]MDP5274106.1 MFS transporter [Chengkuizengella sp. 2205SS18-9]